MKLQGIVGGQGNVEASGQVVRKRITGVGEEERIVAQGTHGDADLREVVQILQHRRLSNTSAVQHRITVTEQAITDVRATGGDHRIPCATGDHGKCSQPEGNLPPSAVSDQLLRSAAAARTYADVVPKKIN